MSELACAFCGKPQRQVRKLIAGPGRICICDGCVAVSNELIADESPELPPLPKPREIHAFLDDYVIGQGHAKRTLAVAVYNHYKRVRSGAGELGKSNILLVGPTGSGKTYLAQTLARMLDVPFAMADATALTEAGYVGEDVETVLVKLLRAADHDVRRAERGIVYLDEVDKLTRKSENPSIIRDVSGEGVQQALLKIIEGTVAEVPPEGVRKHPQQDTVKLDTTNVLFIAGGAFEGLELPGERHAGFLPRAQRARNLPRDLMAYGLIPEFVGRLPVIATLEQLDLEALVRILTEPRNALIKQYRRLFELDGVDLEFTDDAVTAIAEQALLRRTGARATKAIMEEVLLNLMYEVPSRDDIARVVINRDMVRNRVNPTLISRKHDEPTEKSA